MGGIIRQNYLWAVSFNSIGLALAIFGLLNPIFAGLLHHVNSVFVIVNAGRLYFTGIGQSLSTNSGIALSATGGSAIMPRRDPFFSLLKSSGLESAVLDDRNTAHIVADGQTLVSLQTIPGITMMIEESKSASAAAASLPRWTCSTESIRRRPCWFTPLLVASRSSKEWPKTCLSKSGPLNMHWW